jgi:hypothetical protein
MALLTGCASQGDSTDSGGSDLSAPGGSAASKSAPKAATPATAKVTTKKVEKNAKNCSLSAELPVVDTGDKTVNAEIAKFLDSADPENTACSGLLAGETEQITWGYKVTTNERGILAMVFTMSSQTDSDPTPVAVVMRVTLDLATGKRLALTDVLTEAGMKAAEDACAPSVAKTLAGMDEKTVDEEQDRSQSICEDGIAGANSNPSGFTVEKDGLHVELDAVLGEEVNDQLIPWDKLNSGLAHGVVATWLTGTK